MDKSWIPIEDRWTDDAFKSGLENFLEFAYTNKPAQSKIKCPCTKCRNSRLQSKEDVKYHVLRHGFLQGYTNWVHQGEQSYSFKKNSLNASQLHERNKTNDMDKLIHDTLLASHHHGECNENTGSFGFNSDEVPRGHIEAPLNHFDENTKNFFNHLKHAECELFPGCKTFTALSFIVRLLHVKSLCQWSNNSFTMLMEVLKEAFKLNDMFPKSYREAWNIIKELGLEVKKIHACPNDCTLFWKDNVDKFNGEDDEAEYFSSDKSDSNDNDEFFEDIIPSYGNETY